VYKCTLRCTFAYLEKNHFCIILYIFIIFYVYLIYIFFVFSSCSKTQRKTYYSNKKFTLKVNVLKWLKKYNFHENLTIKLYYYVQIYRVLISYLMQFYRLIVYNLQPITFQDVFSSHPLKTRSLVGSKNRMKTHKIKHRQIVIVQFNPTLIY
jgi:hypothetical protein